MPLEFIPDYSGIKSILDRQVQGAYRFVHDARKPYVRIGPAFPDEPITVHQGTGLRLHGGRTRGLKGVDAMMDFAVMLVDDSEELVEVVTPLQQASAQNALDSVAQTMSASVHQPLNKALNAPQVPQPLLTMEGVQKAQQALQKIPPIVPIIHILDDICAREDVHHELGDYLVIPDGSVSAYEPIPAWVVKSSHVEQVYVVKPRLGIDKPIDTLEIS